MKKTFIFRKASYLKQIRENKKVWIELNFKDCMYFRCMILQFTNAHSKRLLLALLSGLLLIVSFPETGGIWPLAFVAWIPLLLAEDAIAQQKKSPFHLLVLAYVTFLIYNIGTTWWIFNSSEVGAYMAFFANALLMSLAFLVFHLLKRKLGSRWNGPLLLCTWITFEFLHFNWELSWPWLTLGNVFAKTTYVVQWYALTGVLGGSVWILLLNLILFKWIKLGAGFISLKNPYFKFGLFILLFPIILSAGWYAFKSTSGQPFHVTIVQPNVDPYHTKFAKSNEEQLTDLIQLIDNHKSPKSQLIVAPETALYPLGYIYESNLRKELFNHRIHEKLFHWNNAGLLIGASTFETFTEKNSSAAVFDPNFNEFIEKYNSSLLFSQETEPAIIHKSKLVLGVEKVPFTDLFPGLEELAVDMEGGSGSLGVERGYKHFVLNKIPFTSNVCYESIYGEFVAKQSKSGSQFIAVITNDGWWGDTPGYKQHFDFSRLRAIENNKYVIRSANTGISGIIDNRGEVIQKTSWWKQQVINGTIYLNTHKTLYQILGDYLGYLSSVGLIAFILFRFYLGFQIKKPSKMQ